MAGSHWAGTERCQRRTSVTRRLHRHPPPHAPLPPPRTGRRQVKGDGRGGEGRADTPTAASLAGGVCPPFSGGGDDDECDSSGIWGGWRVGTERCPGCDAPSPTLPPSPLPPSSLRALHRALFFFVTYFSDTQLAGTSTCPGRSTPPLPGAPSAAAPARRSRLLRPVTTQLGGNRSFLIPARAKLHPALCCRSPSHPRRIPPGTSCRSRSGLAKLLGHGVGKRLGPHPPFPGRPHPSSLGVRIHPCSLGPAFPPLPRGYSRFSRPGAAGGGGSAHPASQGLGVCKEKDNHHGFLQALAQALRSSASTPV